ncbi:arsenate reductase ArsC [Roseovarius salinarum]|uniref:arsenate reductase ArsC n=1 Tax=Roseovarius salinarum TaxID=1981892 RepID=UPI000C34C289|nr:arsenate reductase ArsC [Roseovarius salinarum]
MADSIRNVLFLCTSNSARSIMAEAILNRVGAGRFRGFSAGSRPADAVQPRALALLENLGHDTAPLHPKSWDAFAAPDAPVMHFVFTLCDNAAGEPCPLWPGQPVTAHWGLPDPAAATGSEAEIALAFADCYKMLHRRLTIFVSLPFAQLDAPGLSRHLDDIHAGDDDVSDA